MSFESLTDVFMLLAMYNLTVRNIDVGNQTNPASKYLMTACNFLKNNNKNKIFTNFP